MAVGWEISSLSIATFLAHINLQLCVLGVYFNPHSHLSIIECVFSAHVMLNIYTFLHTKIQFRVLCANHAMFT